MRASFTEAGLQWRSSLKAAFTEDLHAENKDAEGTNELEEVEKSVVHTLPESGRYSGTESVGDFRVSIRGAII